MSSRDDASSLADFTCAVINLRRRRDRWQRISKSLAAKLPWLTVHRVNAVDGSRSPPVESDVTLRWSTAHVASFCEWYSVRTLKMSAGERGCCASHVRCWRKAMRNRHPLIVLEDDAVVLPQFREVLTQAARELEQREGTPQAADVLWLCAKDRGRARRLEAGSVLMRPAFLWTTVGCGATFAPHYTPLLSSLLLRWMRAGTSCIPRARASC